jgi:hypothetical protein
MNTLFLSCRALQCHHSFVVGWPISNLRNLSTTLSACPRSPPPPATRAANRGGGDPSIQGWRWWRQRRWQRPRPRVTLAAASLFPWRIVYPHTIMRSFGPYGKFRDDRCMFLGEAMDKLSDGPRTCNLNTENMGAIVQGVVVAITGHKPTIA